MAGREDHGHPHEPIVDEHDTLALRARAIERLLVEKGVLTPAEIRRAVDDLVSRSPADGARVIARAWTDVAFKARLLADPKAAIAELGIGLQHSAELVVLENTDDVRHVVVCTLCSCYPRALLGAPPAWYKSFAYRSRAVRKPRDVLREFGTDVPEGVELSVHDSTADVRYLVVPRRPAGTEGMSEGALAALVTRDSMIGVSDPLSSTPA